LLLRGDAHLGLLRAGPQHGGLLLRDVHLADGRRLADRWALLATTDFLARSFTWPAPILATARGLGLGAVQALGPVKRLVARSMMFGWR